MKKWGLLTIACVCNGITTTIFFVFVVYEMLTSNDPTDITFIVISTISIGYAIYLISDILGIKLYYRFKNKDSLSFTDKQAIRAILFFLGVVQLGMSYLFSLSIGRVVSDIMNFNIKSFHAGKVVDCLIVGIFFTGLITFIGYIFLLRAINKNKIIVKKEIENIGENNF